MAEPLEQRVLFSTYNIAGGFSTNEAALYTLNLASSSTSITSWTINWGDGATATPDTQVVTGNPSTVQHVYSKGPNTFSVSATATDTAGTHTAHTTVLDSSFGSGGIASTALDSGEKVLSTAIQSDGKIVAAIYSNVYGNSYLRRYTAGGVLDTSFGTGGSVTLSDYDDYDAGTSSVTLALQDDGSIVVADFTGDYASWLVERFDSSGNMDTSFGSSGQAWLSATNTPASNLGGTSPMRLVLDIQSDGKILVGGCAYYMTGTLVRLTDEGAIDESFGVDGYQTVQNSGYSTISSLAVGADGTIYAAGYGTPLPSHRRHPVRLIPRVPLRRCPSLAPTPRAEPILLTVGPSLRETRITWALKTAMMTLPTIPSPISSPLELTP